MASPNSQAPEQLATFSTDLVLQKQDKALAPVIAILEAADENLPASIKEMVLGYSLLQQGSSSDELALFYSEEKGVDRLVTTLLSWRQGLRYLSRLPQLANFLLSSAFLNLSSSRVQALASILDLAPLR